MCDRFPSYLKSKHTSSPSTAPQDMSSNLSASFVNVSDSRSRTPNARVDVQSEP